MKAIHRALLCGTSALAIGLVSVPATAAETDDSNVEVIVITGIRGSLRESLVMKRNSELVTDNISTSDIGQLPDVTIAEELNRLPGVNTTRDRGNASQASVRGLGPRLVLGLLNGREVASSEPSQDLRWEIYPSEILGGVQVYKSQSSEMIPGGIAATIDIRTLKALDYQGPEFTMRAGPEWNDLGGSLPDYNPWGFRGSAGYFAHLSNNFAIGLAASYQKQKNGFPDFRTFGWNTPLNSGDHTGDLNGDGVPDDTTWGLVTEVKEIEQERLGFAGTAGWRASQELEVNFDVLYSKYTIEENQAQTWYGNNFMGNWADAGSGPGGYSFAQYNCPTCSYEIRNGSVVSGNLPGSYPNYQSALARYEEEHELWSVGMNADWTRGAWNAKLDLSHSEAARDNRWQAVYLDTVGWPDTQDLIFDIAEGHEPSASMPGFDPLAHLSASPARQGQSDGPAETRDHISAATFDVTRTFEGSFFKSISAGARISDREKTYQIFRYNLCPGSTTSGECDGNAGFIDLSNAGLSSFTVDAFNAPPMVWGDWDKIFHLVYPDSSVPSWAELIGSRSNTGETTAEGYLKVGFATEGRIPMTGSIGVRVASVDTESHGFFTTNGGATFNPVTIKNSYTDWLPSLNMIFHLADDQVLRFGASIGISRPPLDALVASFSLNPIIIGQPNTGGGGNPLLKPYKANQLDLSYEWYFHEESLFAIALYYKDLSDFIGASSSIQTINGVDYIIGSENNGPGGDISGVEFTFQTRFYFLSGFLQDFGVYSNYAYVDSDIHEFAPSNDPYTMVGLAKHTGEIDLYYNKGPVEARVAYKFHSPFTVAPTWVGTTLKEIDAEQLWGASISYQWNEHIGIRLQGNNLTDEPTRFTSDNNTQHLSNDGGYREFGRTFLLDVSYKW